MGEPQSAIELEPVVSPEEDAVPILNSGDDVVLQDDNAMPADAVTEPFDDQVQDAVSSLRTGLGGAPGCSNFASATPDPLLLLVLLMSIASLTRTSKRITKH